MPDLWIPNASPLIALAGIGHADVLMRLTSRILISASVVREVTAGTPQDPARLLLESGWGERVPDPPVTSVVQAWGLGAGESAVISLGESTPGAELVLDDAQARRCARSLNLRVRGTVGVLVLARTRGLIPSLRETLARLNAAGFYLDDAVIAEALRLAGES